MRLKKKIISSDPFVCEHANENPNYCYCPADCYCRIRTCKGKPVRVREGSSPEKVSGLIIRSGFQRGVDIAAIRAARKIGLETIGAMPLGYLTLDGMKPEYREWGAYEMMSREYRTRTEENVRRSDGTLRIAYDWKSPGELCTMSALNKWGKPVFNVNVADCQTEKQRGMILYNLVEWIRREKIKVLNVAGNADAELEGFVEGLLGELFSRMGVGK